MKRCGFGRTMAEMVWIDLEMTGLDLNTESIIEIATIIADELNIMQKDLILQLRSVRPSEYG